MNVQDRQLIEAMQRELDELIVEEQISMEVAERIRAAHQPPTPYEETPEYLAEQAAIEAELAVAREIRRSSTQRSPHQGVPKISCGLERIPELKKLRDELRLLEPHEHDVFADSRTTQSLQGSIRSTQSSPRAFSSEEQSTSLLIHAMEKGRLRRASLQAMRDGLERQAAENVYRASKHARDLEAAREAAAVAAAYERKYESMRASLRHDVLVEAFGDKAFRSLSPIRVEQADLFLEFPYEDDKEFGICSRADASLEALLEVYRQEPHIWCFFSSRCSPISFRDGSQAAPVVTSAEVHEGEDGERNTDEEKAVQHHAAPVVDALQDDVRERVAEGCQRVVSSSGGVSTAEGVRLCRDALEETKGPLAALEEEQRLHEDALRARHEAAQRLAASREARYRRSSDISMTASTSTQPSNANFLCTTTYIDSPLPENAVSGTEVTSSINDDDAPHTFAPERPEIIQRYIPQHNGSSSVAAEEETLSAFLQSHAHDMCDGAIDCPTHDMLIQVRQPSNTMLLVAAAAPAGGALNVHQQRHRSVDTSACAAFPMLPLAQGRPPRLSISQAPSSYTQSLSRRNLTKILKFNPALDEVPAS